MNFSELKMIINKSAKNNDFKNASKYIENIIFNLDSLEFLPLIIDIGAIPEDIPHDSTEEKLYTKVSDIILAKCFIELGLKANVLSERANSADVIAKSCYHNYSLVADAKSFRLSRTAKNQKDFKVESMIHWKNDNDYSILCSPYFQYPQAHSQIYASALEGNVSLFSWEYFYILLSKNTCETPYCNLSVLWNYSKEISANVSVASRCSSFLSQQDEFIRNILNISADEFKIYFNNFKKSIIERCQLEVEYWENIKLYLSNLSREEAIEKLIESMKLNEKINSINRYVNRLSVYDEVR